MSDQLRLIGDEEVEEIHSRITYKEFEPHLELLWMLEQLGNFLATREAIIKKIQEITMKIQEITMEYRAYEIGFEDACRWILDFIRNPKEEA